MIITSQIIALAFYLSAIAILLRQWLTSTTTKQLNLHLTSGIAVISHVLLLYLTMPTAQGIDIGFFNAMSFTAALMALLLVLASLSQPVACLGLLVYPFAVASIILRIINQHPHFLSPTLAPGLQAHILFSLLAYSLLSIAVAQAILLYIQDKYLHNKHPAGFLRSLPSLETMEILLFKMISIGLLALSVSLISGFVYLENMFAQHLVHKTILSLFAWFVFAGLIWGHKTLGWRGKIAIRWTMTGFVLLMLAYFGSKFVIELILKQ